MFEITLKAQTQLNQNYLILLSHKEIIKQNHKSLIAATSLEKKR